MKLTVIDRFEEEEAICLLCKTTLSEYVKALNSDFKDYYVQRGIVSNRYLDNLWDTIAKRKHIPTIVLVSDGDPPTVTTGQSGELTEKFKVLDGLQRTNRIKEAWDAVEIYNSTDDDHSISPIRLARKLSDRLKAAEVSSALFQRAVKSARDGVDLTKLFESNNIWLEIWFNMTDSQQIQKMLILNAGHKSVNIKHQVELLFIGYLPILQKALGSAKIVRERDRSSLAYSKSRIAGEFHFAHLISAFVSLNAGKPITTNADFSAEKSFEDSDNSDTLLGTDERLLVAFANLLEALDKALSGRPGTKWLGREVVLVGLFGAVGSYSHTHSLTYEQSLQRLRDNLDDFVISLNLSSFEEERNSLDLSKVNLGSVNKLAVYNATKKFLENPSPALVNWRQYFGVVS